jgi:hypothetical protein
MFPFVQEAVARGCVVIAPDTAAGPATASFTGQFGRSRHKAL